MTLLHDLSEGTFQIDFRSASLTQASNPGEKYIIGSGSLWVDSDGQFRYQITASDTNIDMQSWLRGVSVNSVGQLYKDEDYFDLEIIDDDGTNFRAPRLLPDWNFSFKDPLNASGKANIIISTRQSVAADFRLSIQFFEKIEFPFNEYSDTFIDGQRHTKLNTASCKLGSISIKFEENDTGFLISAQSETTMPDDLEIRLLEALRFSTGRAYYPRLTCISNSEREERVIRRRITSQIKSRAYPPIQQMHPFYSEAILQLFTTYLDFVIKNGPKNEWHPLSFQLSNFLDGSNGDLHLQAMALGVAIEGALAFLDAPIDEDEVAIAAKFRSVVIDFANGAFPGSKLPSRLAGMLGRITEISPQDKIKWLIESGWIDKSQINAWRNLRNKHVHPTRKFIDPTDATYIQDLIDSMHKVVVLFYQIIFYIISYEGKYTDYGTYGFPDKETPCRIA